MRTQEILNGLRRFGWYYAPALAWMGFLIFLAFQPDLKSSLPTKYDLIFRKIGHVAVYFIATVLWARIGLSNARDKNEVYASIFVGALAGYMIAIQDETIQSFIPGRSGSMKDVGFDVVGILTAMGILFWKGKKRQEI